MTGSSISSNLPTLSVAGLAALRRRPSLALMILAGIVYTGVSLLILGGVEGLATVRPRLDLTPFLSAPIILRVHIAAAITSFAIGCALMTGIKGGRRHRAFGYAWIAAMTLTAVSSVFLTGINPGRFSFIHALSAWTLVTLPMGLAAARRRNFKAHRRQMTGLFLGGLAIAGLFTFLPGRMMWRIFFAA